MMHKNLIGYEESAISEKRIFSFYPALQKQHDVAFAAATASEVDSALKKAYSAWRLYRDLPGTQRAAFLRAIADGIEAAGDTLVQTTMEETAYPESRVLVERGRTCAQLRMFADIAERNEWQEITIDIALPDRKPLPRPELKKISMPLGPVVVFGASNFPLAYSTAGGDVASALCVGCPVIVKAHDSHLRTNAMVANVIQDAALSTSMPDGVFSSLHGDGFETGKQLVQHPLTAAVGFTGSLSGGRALFDLASQREEPIPVFAEMGSVNPVFIFPEAITTGGNSLVTKLVASMTMTVGQFCTCPGIVCITEDANTNWFIENLKNELMQIQAQPMLNTGIASNFRKGVERIDKLGNSKWIVKRDEHEISVSPVLAICDERDFLENPRLHHEIFGPYALVVLCKSMAGFHQIAESLKGQLTASVFAEAGELSLCFPLVSLLSEKAGRIIYNGVPTGVEVCAAMTHGGPYPASTDSRFTAVGHHAVRRWIRPVTFQNFPEGSF